MLAPLRGHKKCLIVDQFFGSAPGVFLVGSGVSGFNAPVFLVVAGGVCADFASLGVTPSVLSEPGAPGSAGFSALTGVPARTSIATAKAVAACFICGDLLGEQNSEAPAHFG